MMNEAVRIPPHKIRAPGPYSAIEHVIRRIEIKHNLLQYEIDGWCVWPQLRFGVTTTLMNLPFVPPSRIRFSQRLRLALCDISGLIAVPHVRHLIKTYSSALMEQEGDSYRDVFFDELIQGVGSYFKIEAFNNPSFVGRSEKALIKRDMTSTLFELIPGLLARIKLRRDIQDVAHELSACLQNEMGRTIFTSRLIALNIFGFYCTKNLYGMLLDRMRPKYVLIADPGEYSLTAATKERGVKVCEFQHGFLDRDQHPAYSWAAHALPSKARMPIPDRLLLYGEHWKEELDVNEFWGDSLVAVGSLRMDHYRKMRQAGNPSQVCSIVLTTQGLDVDRIIAFMSEFLAQIHGRLDYRLYVKLHPCYETSKAAYESAFSAYANVTVLLGSEAPSTFELLAQARLHITISSTCHYDALGLGVPTIILPFTTHEIALPLREAGHAHIVHTPQELADMAVRWREYTVSRDISEWLFKSGALENIKRELELT